LTVGFALGLAAGFVCGLAVDFLSGMMNPRQQYL
jgi:hypothetical protein